MINGLKKKNMQERARKIFCLNTNFFDMTLKKQLQFIYNCFFNPDLNSPFRTANFGGFPQLGNPEWHELYELVTSLAQEHNICCVCNYPNKDVSRATHDDEFSYDARVKGLCANCSNEGI